MPDRVREVLEYFLRNPSAADSLEGIARWRLEQETIQRTVDGIDAAIGWLVARGFLVRESPAGAPAVFRLNEYRAADAQRFLEDGLAQEMGRAVPDPAALGSVPRAVLSWIDAVLLRHHRRNPSASDDLPGLTRSASSVEAALRDARDADEPAAGADADVPRAAAHVLQQALADAVGADEPLAAVFRRLDLSSLELHALLLGLAPELDAKYQGVFGVFNDDLGRRTPTLALACALLGDPLSVRRALGESAGLTRWRLLDGGASLPAADEPLRLDPATVAWLLGDRQALWSDPRVGALVRRTPWAGGSWLRGRDDTAMRADLARSLALPDVERPWLTLAGPDPDGWCALVEAAAADAGRVLLRLDLAPLAAGTSLEVDEAAVRLARAARLLDCVPILDVSRAHDERVAIDAVARLVTTFDEAGLAGALVVPDVPRVMVAMPRGRTRILHRNRPDSAAHASALVVAAHDAGLSLEPHHADRLARTFPLSLPALDDAIHLARARGAVGEPADRHGALLGSAMRRIASPDLPRFARRIEPAFRLADVVLPVDRRAQLDEMVAHVVHAATVLDLWGFGPQLPYGRGVAGLFCGPSGTGKTMAAQAIAHELQAEAYVVDLSRVVSKYIGESEKNLDAVFSDAERAGAVLVFDEADALFGKRSEIKDAHDRYANIEVAYLLQRMEAFAGLAILTTNRRQNLDQAFLRRLRFVVEFPKPDVDAREEIWRRCLPGAAPRGEDIRFRSLAKQLELTGGNIRQITLRAAFAAAAEGAAAIEMRHVVSATRAELLKLGMPGAERELAELEDRRLGSAPRAA